MFKSANERKSKQAYMSHVVNVPFLDNATHNEWHGMHQINKKYFDFKMSKTCKKSTHQNFLLLLKPMHLYTSVLNIKLSIQYGQNSPEK